MKTLNVRTLLPIAALLCLAAANPARAQAPLEPAQMSPRTLFYLIWHGVPGAEARKANALLALWDDADFATGAVGAGGGDAEFFGGQTGASETHAGAGAGIRRGCWKIRSRLGM